ncbi:hypothetical protein BGX31_011065 [Mortierella sp. GBA43]|nr:hypothetical protein BGX31_011065 [Mortierella sp. GBA43]
MEFYNTALGMLSTDLMRDPFKKLTDQIRTRFPNAGEWLDWYLHPSLGKLIFSALACHQNSHMSSGTNAQESLGYDFKRNAIRSKLDIPETVEHVYRYATRLTTNWQKMEQNCIMENAFYVAIRLTSLLHGEPRQMMLAKGEPEDQKSLVIHHILWSFSIYYSPLAPGPEFGTMQHRYSLSTDSWEFLVATKSGKAKAAETLVNIDLAHIKTAAKHHHNNV